VLLTFNFNNSPYYRSVVAGSSQVVLMRVAAAGVVVLIVVRNRRCVSESRRLEKRSPGSCKLVGSWPRYGGFPEVVMVESERC